MRLPLFKTVLVLSNGKELPITIAAREITEIEALVEKNKVYYTTAYQKVERFFIAETRYTFDLSDEKYEEELTYCDIVQE